MRESAKGFAFIILIISLIVAAACGEKSITLVHKNIDSDTSEKISTDSLSDTMADSDSDTLSDTETGSICLPLADRIRVTDIDVGQKVIANEQDAGLMPIALSPIPRGGTRLVWLGDDNLVHISTLNSNDVLTDNSVALSAADFQDIHATDNGGVILLTRDAEGGGTLNCGSEDNLCGIPDAPIPCYDMYMVGFEGNKETFATKLTSARADLPPYSTGPTGMPVSMIWWYGHHGRIASDGTSYAAYYGTALSVSNGECVNIHQGDQMRVLDEGGNIIDGGFNWGCSPSGYERVIWNDAAHAYVAVCKSEEIVDTEGSGVLAFAPDHTAIWHGDPWYSNFSELVVAKDGGYWMGVSDRKAGEPERSSGLAQVLLLHFTSSGVDLQYTIEGEINSNTRAPHLAGFGEDQLLLMYESSPDGGEMSETDLRTVTIETRSYNDGTIIGEPIVVPDVRGHRYNALRTFPDGTVAFPIAGTTDHTIKIMRITPCP
ncbi:MAG: hypothetical protein JXR91_11505 [Deltaproteobacteria bacterium]|nr:hypothetical protein [Deltaproteobacteria bacterium]